MKTMSNQSGCVTGIEVIHAALTKYPLIKGVCADGGYRKTFREAAEKLGLKVDISERIKPQWELLPKR